ncbi:MAG TPA: hypothetical protein VF766_07820 [Pyrinomonadaceae bacterium]
MRILLLFIVALLIPADRPKWELVVSTEAEEYFRQDKPVRSLSDYIVQWEIHKPKDTPEGRELRETRAAALEGVLGSEKARRYGFSVVQRGYDCRRKRVTFIRGAYHAPDEAWLGEMSGEELKAARSIERRAPAPGSVDERLLKETCARVPLVK